MPGFPHGNITPLLLKSPLILLAAAALHAGFAQADIYRSLDPETPTKWTRNPADEGSWELFYKEKPLPVAETPAPIPDKPQSVDRRDNSPGRFASQIQAAAAANNVDPALLRAVISVESGYNPSAVSRAGAVGLMQLMPMTAKRYQVKDSRDPGQNIHGGAKYLRDLLRMFNNDLHLVLAAYNAGEEAVMKYGNRIPPFRETLAYVPKVMKFYRQYAQHTGSQAATWVLRGSSDSYTSTEIRGRVSRTYIHNPS